jgi:hypothetical protein
MPVSKANSGDDRTFATQKDITDIFGTLDTEQLLAIMALHPTIADIEAASIWLSGDNDVFGAGEPLKGAASDIVTILTAEEGEEPPRA